MYMRPNCKMVTFYSLDWVNAYTCMHEELMGIIILLETRCIYKYI